jgi:membrane protein DedA with SNARE-associated domain
VIVLLGVGIESIGVPVPGELTLLVGVVLAGQGRLSVPLVALFAWIGAVTGDNLGYLVGRRWGRRLVATPVIRNVYSLERMERAERLFESHGWIAVFSGRFIALLRIFAGPLAGMHRMPWRRFVIANAAGGAFWIAAIVVVGLVIASNLDQALILVGRAGYIGLGVALLAVMTLVTIGVRARRRRPPT